MPCAAGPHGVACFPRPRREQDQPLLRDHVLAGQSGPKGTLLFTADVCERYHGLFIDSWSCGIFTWVVRYAEHLARSVRLAGSAATWSTEAMRGSWNERCWAAEQASPLRPHRASMYIWGHPRCSGCQKVGSPLAPSGYGSGMWPLARIGLPMATSLS